MSENIKMYSLPSAKCFLADHTNHSLKVLVFRTDVCMQVSSAVCLEVTSWMITFKNLKKTFDKSIRHHKRNKSKRLASYFHTKTHLKTRVLHTVNAHPVQLHQRCSGEHLVAIITYRVTMYLRPVSRERYPVKK